MPGVFYYKPRQARKEGTRDGKTWRWRFGWPPWEEKEPYPPEDSQDPPEYEKQLYKVAESELHELAEKWQKKDASLRNACAEAEREYFYLDDKLKKQSGGQAKIIKNYEVARQRFESFENPAWNKLTHILIFMGIFFGEFIFNTVVFNIFGETKVATWIMAGSLGIAIPVAGELLGRSYRTESRNKKDTFLMIIGGGILVAVLGGVSYFRLKFFEASKMAEILGISVSAPVFFLIFLSLNLLFVLVCAWTAYMAAHKNPEAFEKAKRQFKEAAQENQKLKADLRELSERLFQSRKKFYQAHIQRDKEFRGFQERANVKQKGIAVLVHTYRQANIRARKEKAGVPMCFQIEPKSIISIPYSLGELDCAGCLYEQLPDPFTQEIPGQPLPPPAVLGEEIAVPLVLTEINDPKAAKALFESFVTKTGLNNPVQLIEENSSIRDDELSILLEGVPNPRPEKNSKVWENAWLKLLSGWNELDKKLMNSFPQGQVYHLYPHVVLPLAFVLGASVGLRRKVFIYHEQAGNFFKVLELSAPRVLFAAPPQDIPAPELREQAASSRREAPSRLVLHLFISDRHSLDFKSHPEWEKADNKALFYNQALPEGSWLGYLQHLVSKTNELIKDYQEVELCLLAPAAVAFALGMALSRTPKIKVCHWFAQERPSVYQFVYSLQEVEEQIAAGRVFS